VPREKHKLSINVATKKHLVGAYLLKLVRDIKSFMSVKEEKMRVWLISRVC
jgi:hypothetical protein